MFKNAFVYHLIEPVTLTQEALLQGVFSPCTELQHQSVGWAPLVKDGDLLHEVAGYTLLKLQIDTKLLPSSVVKKVLATRITEIEEREDRKLAKKEKSLLKDQIIFELLPKAFISTGFIMAYLDIKTGIIVVDGSSGNKCEILLDFLRKTLGTLAVKPYGTDQNVSQIMTDWLKGSISGGEMLLIGSNIEITTDTEEKASVKLKNIDPLSHQVTEHLDAGGLVTKIDVNLNDQLSFMLHNDLSFHKLKLTAIEDGDYGNDENEASRLSADLILFAGVFAQLFNAVNHLFVTNLEQ